MSGLFILSVIAAYVVVLMLVSHFTSRSSSNDTFFTGNRQSPWAVVAIGMIGASLSGVTFVSVPGMVGSIQMTYMQTVMGFFVGYLAITYLLLPIYYRLQLTTIYTYLQQRIGNRAYYTGASFFILSKTVGAAVRLYLVAVILHNYVFSPWNVPFPVTIVAILLLIWVYTRKSGIRTIVWTDLFQTLSLLLTVVLIVWAISERLNLGVVDLVELVANSPHSKIFEFDDWVSTQNFYKQFFSGIFIAIVMTGLDQDMMQKNLTCRNLKEAQRNMITYGFGFLPVNLIFLTLGVLLITLAQAEGIALPAKGDDILPFFTANGYLGVTVAVFFTIGIIAASFSSADSALTALTTSVCVDLLRIDRYSANKAVRTRRWVHLGLTLLFVAIILIFKALNSKSVIDAIYIIASYTYGPLLGLFAFGIFTRRITNDRFTPAICILSPIICFAIDTISVSLYNYKFGYELLMLNGLLTFVGLWVVGKPTNEPATVTKPRNNDQWK